MKSGVEIWQYYDSRIRRTWPKKFGRIFCSANRARTEASSCIRRAGRYAFYTVYYLFRLRKRNTGTAQILLLHLISTILGLMSRTWNGKKRKEESEAENRFELQKPVHTQITWSKRSDLAKSGIFVFLNLYHFFALTFKTEMMSCMTHLLRLSETFFLSLYFQHSSLRSVHTETKNMIK